MFYFPWSRQAITPELVEVHACQKPDSGYTPTLALPKEVKFDFAGVDLKVVWELSVGYHCSHKCEVDSRDCEKTSCVREGSPERAH